MTDASPAAGDPADKILLRDHIVEVEIGAFQQERGVTQRLRISLVADLRARVRQNTADDVDKVLSYDHLLHAIEATLAGARLNLLETLAEGIATRVLAHRGLAKVRVRIEKLDRCSGGLGIEITRCRAAVSPSQPEMPMVAARVLVLGPSVLDDPRLPEMIDRIVAGDGAVLCAEPRLAAPVVAQTPSAQRQIDLLSMGQAAWKLAGRDPRCSVVDSRTEIDWALRNGKVVVWAPAKMVADAHEDLPSGTADLPGLALWLAGLLGAAHLELVGDVTAPAPTDRVSLLRKDVEALPI